MNNFMKTLMYCSLILFCDITQCHHLKKVTDVMPHVKTEIWYATAHNFTGQQIYQDAYCYLHEDTLEHLAAVQETLKQYGLGLKIWDGFRPLSAQQTFWDLIQDTRYVSNPNKGGGRHTRGTAVDCTLVTLEDGIELPMPTEFDNFTEKAHRNYMDLSEEALANRSLLEAVMVANGFIGISTEWWHFDLRGWNDKDENNQDRYPVITLNFEDLE